MIATPPLLMPLRRQLRLIDAYARLSLSHAEISTQPCFRYIIRFTRQPHDMTHQILPLRHATFYE